MLPGTDGSHDGYREIIFEIQSDSVAGPSAWNDEQVIARDSRFANGAATSVGALPHRDAAAAAAFAMGEFEIATVPSLPNVAAFTAYALAT